MTLKARRNETLELHANSIKPRTEDTSSNYATSREEIRRRAYEIYLGRDGLGGNALDDWLQAEAELIAIGVGQHREEKVESPAVRKGVRGE